MLKVVLQVLQVATIEVDANADVAANIGADSDATDAPSDG